MDLKLGTRVNRNIKNRYPSSYTPRHSLKLCTDAMELNRTITTVLKPAITGGKLHPVSAVDLSITPKSNPSISCGKITFGIFYTIIRHMTPYTKLIHAFLSKRFTFASVSFSDCALHAPYD